MLLFLSSHHDFDKMVEKYIPAKDLAAIRDTVITLKTKVSIRKHPFMCMILSVDLFVC